MNKSFENITSTEKALNLLRQFQAVLQRESLKSDLDDKYLVIFQNYGLDLESIQKRYEKWKSSPPVMRNTPPVSGAIMWARNLFRRMEEPMQKYDWRVFAIIAVVHFCRMVAKAVTYTEEPHTTCFRNEAIMHLFFYCQVFYK